MTIREARDAVVAALESAGINESVKIEVGSWSHCYTHRPGRSVDVECRVWLAESQRNFVAPTLDLAVALACSSIQNYTGGENVEAGEIEDASTGTPA